MAGASGVCNAAVAAEAAERHHGMCRVCRYYLAIVADLLLRFLWTFSLIPTSQLPPAIASRLEYTVRTSARPRPRAHTHANTRKHTRKHTHASLWPRAHLCRRMGPWSPLWSMQCHSWLRQKFVVGRCGAFSGLRTSI